MDSSTLKPHRFRDRAARIVATLGPASSSKEIILELVKSGVDVFRFNFSHGTHEDHATRHAIVREIEQEVGHPIGILADLQGPKLRLGTFKNERISLTKGDIFRLDRTAEPGNHERVSLPHPEIFEAAKVGDTLLIDDGKMRLEIIEISELVITTRLLNSGTLSDRKGVNVPDSVLKLSPLTPKDRQDLAFALDLGVDWVALSFVQRAHELSEARRLISGRAAMMAKIEKPSAIDELDDIVAACDGIMVARGDLGVELPPETVPSLQKRIVSSARLAGKPVVVATQMLESMISSPSPTRAEASDVATAVYDGADALMLSAESAAGQYPVEAVRMMDSIMCSIEHASNYRRYLSFAQGEDLDPMTVDAITSAAVHAADLIDAAAIVTFTTSGSTTVKAARQRPSQPIIGLMPSISTARRLSLLWGVHCVVSPDVSNLDEMAEVARIQAQESGIAKPGEGIVITAGVPFGTPGATNVMRIAWIS